MTILDPLSRKGAPGNWIRIVPGELTKSIYGSIGALDRESSTGIITLYSSKDWWPVCKESDWVGAGAKWIEEVDADDDRD